MDDELVLVGEITAPFGIRGELKMTPHLEHPELLQKVPAVILRVGDTPRQSYRVTGLRRHQGQVLLQLEGIDRNAAEALRRARVFLRREDFPPLPEDQYYEWQLLGLDVVTEAGVALGPIIQVHFNPAANDVYETPRAMIPAHRAFVRSVDLAAGTVTVVDDPGLLSDAH